MINADEIRILGDLALQQWAQPLQSLEWNFDNDQVDVTDSGYATSLTTTSMGKSRNDVRVRLKIGARFNRLIHVNAILRRQFDFKFTDGIGNRVYRYRFHYKQLADVYGRSPDTDEEQVIWTLTSIYREILQLNRTFHHPMHFQCGIKREENRVYLVQGALASPIRSYYSDYRSSKKAKESYLAYLLRRAFTSNC